MSRARFRRWFYLKWAGLAVSVALLTVLLAPPIQVDAKNTGLWVFNGSVIVFHQPVGPGIDADVWYNWKADFGNNVGLIPEYRSITLQAGKLISISVPLVPFLLLVIIATLVLWRLDRRFPVGCCRKCGYGLTGNVSGVCPECGTEIERP